MASVGPFVGESVSSDLAHRNTDERALLAKRTGLPDERQLPLLPSVRAALLQLLQAYDYAEDLNTHVWDFAVELSCLRQFGVTRNDCRWLLHKGYVDRGREVSIDADGGRNFEKLGTARVNDDSAFVLTPVGYDFARRLQSDGALLPGSLAGMLAGDGHKGQAINSSLLESTKPLWDQQRQELRVGRAVIKQYKVPAANQEAILASFQEEDWPPRIDDPLIPKGDQDPKRRLHDTINSLNRNQKQPILHFFGDGTGQGIRWEYRRSEMGLPPR